MQVSHVDDTENVPPSSIKVEDGAHQLNEPVKPEIARIQRFREQLDALKRERTMVKSRDTGAPSALLGQQKSEMPAKRDPVPEEMKQNSHVREAAGV